MSRRELRARQRGFIYRLGVVLRSGSPSQYRALNSHQASGHFRVNLGVGSLGTIAHDLAPFRYDITFLNPKIAILETQIHL
jgi:hypothetical protein